MATSIFQLAERLSYEDKVRLARCLEGLIAEERAAIADAGFAPERCPHCGCASLVSVFRQPLVSQNSIRSFHTSA